MIRLFFLILFFLSVSIKLFSQNQSNIENKKRIEYLYNHQDWRQLIKVCSVKKDSIKKDSKTSFYLAISYYKLGKYRIANNYFDIAYKTDTSKFLKENYYTSLVLNDNIIEARKLSDDITDSLLREKINVKKNTFVISISALYGAFFSNDFDKNVTKNINDTIFNNIYRDKINQYFAGNINLRLNSYYNLYLSYSNSNILKMQSVVLDTFNQDFNINCNENNMFFKIKYNSLKTDWYVGLNLWDSQEKYHYFQYKDNDILKATQYISKMSNYLFANGNYNFNYVSVGLNFGYGDLFYHKQVQLGLNFEYYPFANNDLVLYFFPTYIKTKNLYHKYYTINNLNNNSYYSNIELITKLGCDVKLLDNFRFSASANFGGINILHKTPDFFIYDDFNDIRSLYEIKITYSIINNLSFFIYYSYSNQIHYYINNYSTNNSQLMSYQSFMGGLKYNF